MKPGCWPIIYDDTGRDSLLKDLLKDPVLNNVVYIRKEKAGKLPAAAKTNCHYIKVKDFMVYCPKRFVKKIGDFDEIVDCFLQQGSEDEHYVSQFFGLELAQHSDWFCLMASMLR
jgi:hypothetical protein